MKTLYTTDSDNIERAKVARAAVEAFCRRTRQDIRLELDEAIGDLLCNLMHLSRQSQLSFDQQLATAHGHFLAESYQEDIDLGDGEDPAYPYSDWQHEVANGDTRRGYAQWVAACRERDTVQDAQRIEVNAGLTGSSQRP